MKVKSNFVGFSKKVISWLIAFTLVMSTLTFDLVSFATEIKSDDYSFGVSEKTWEEKYGSLPRTIYLGDWGDAGHMQGLAVDDELEYIYASFTTVLAKIEIKTGKIVGKVVDVPGHIGDLAYYDGRIYSGVSLSGYKVFYAAAFDCDKIVGEVKFEDCGTAMHLAEVRKDYLEDFGGQFTINNGHDSTGHAYGANGVDGIAFGTIPGDNSGEIVMMVTVGAYNGGSEEYPNQDRNYQKILQYSLDSFLEPDGNGGTKFKEDVSQNNMGSSYTKGPEHQDKYFLLTGGSPYGSQNLDYDDATGNYIMATYGITGDGFPSYNKFVIDGSIAPRVETLDLGNRQDLYASMPNTNPGCTNMAEGKVVKHAQIGTYHEATGIWGNKNGGDLQTGVDHLYDNYFYISEIFTDETTGGDSANAHLYEWNRETDTFSRVLTQTETLDLLITKAESISLGYTDESLVALNSALAEAKAISGNADVTEIAKVIDALQNAINNLQVKTNSDTGYSDTIDSIPADTNILYDSTKGVGSASELNGSLKYYLKTKTTTITNARMGTVNTSNAITKITGPLGNSDNLNDKYAAGEDLIIGNKLGTTYTSDNNTTGNKIAGQPFKGAYVKKVADPDNSNNNVLEFNFGQTGSNKADTNWKGMYLRLENTHKPVLTEIVDSDHTVKGKVVYEWKVRVPKESVKLFPTKNTYWISLGGIISSESYLRLLDDGVIYNGSGLAVVISGYNMDTGVDGEYSHVISPDEWHTFRQVVNVSKDTLTSGIPIIDYYVDGKFIGSFKSENSLIGSASSGWSSGIWAAELGPTATGDSTIDTNNMIVYYDDIKQYWMSDLTVSALEENYSNFSASDKIEISYSSPVDAEALKKAITVTKNGTKTDVTAQINVKGETTAVISFIGLNFAEETEYDVVISEFADIFGVKNKNAKSFTLTTKAAGKMKVTPSVSDIYGYEAGTHSLFTVSTEYKADISNLNFYIKDQSGNIISELSPVIDETGKILTFDLYDASLENTSAQYTFVSEGYFVQADGDAMNSDIITIPITVINYLFDGTYLINDDFQDVALNENWLTNSSAKPSDYKINGQHIATIRGSYQLNSDGKTYSYQGCNTCNVAFDEGFLTDYFIGVTTDPNNDENKVLKYQSGKNGDGSHGFRVIHDIGATEIDPSKNLVMSAKILLTDSLKGKISSNRNNYLPIFSTRQNFENNYIRTTITSTDTSITISGQGGMKTELPVGEWFEIKYVVLPTTNVTTSADGNKVTYDRWKYMTYINSVPVAVNELTEFDGYNGSMTKSGVTYEGAFATTDNTGLCIYGVHMGLYPENNNDYQPTLYVDDIRLYQPDQFTSTAQLNGSVVTVNYNNVLAKATLDKVTVTDEAGRVVDRAIKDIWVAPNGKSLFITLNTTVMSPDSVYKISPVTDINGQVSAPALFTTPKSFSVYIDDMSEATVNAEGNVEISVKIANATDTKVPAVLMVAVYSDNYEMAGLSAVEIKELDASGYEGKFVVDIGNCAAENIASVRVLLWDSIFKMMPYQNAETAVLKK